MRFLFLFMIPQMKDINRMESNASVQLLILEVTRTLHLLGSGRLWFENVLKVDYITKIDVITNTQSANITVWSTTDGALLSLQVLDGFTVVSEVSAHTGAPVIVSVPKPKLWSPNSPFLYTLRVSLATGDSVSSYFGLREYSLEDVRHPAVPPTGPQNGIDRPGNDLPGSPFKLTKPDPNLCWDYCNKTAACQSWAYAIPNCQGGGYSEPMCWLKTSTPGSTSNQCRVSGTQGLPAADVKKPYLNGEPIFLVGWLDQSWWPDGQYTAPTDEALKFDLQAVKYLGFNLVRLHQKVNSERWYWYADSLGIILFQDMIQKYGGATTATVEPFMKDLTSMINGKISHPSIVQWTAFNEEDCYHVFDVPKVVDYIRKLDPSRLVDTDSGGGANNLHIGDVNDVHTYPYPGHPLPSATQYAMIGEYGGIGAFVSGHEWVPHKCYTYLHANTPKDESNLYITMLGMIAKEKLDVSAVVYTQITDVELECDGFFNFDRTIKFESDDVSRIVQANKQLVNSFK
eukprot:TRINITY_DN17358_c0_g2_i1.p1 TRINITY_DN17358_c0_g2~~TRINITY_DN17358_c0_g2_i1.p1  ORF type:complete len:514 (-),score=78.44 TRINITY_DN17358_c0_g2_i1:70-1611(-)